MFSFPQMEHRDFVSAYLTGKGVEIGAFKTPIPGIRPTYVDRFGEYAGEPTLAEYYGDACELPFEDDSLDFIATSHVLEHVANPLAALKEWHRALRHGGIVYMVVPDRAVTFDRLRALTSVSHLLDDFRKGVTQVDGTHIDDFVFGVDWKLFSPNTPASEEKQARETLAENYRRSVRSGLEINIHFHTFERASAVEMIAAGNAAKLWEGKIQVIESVERFPSSNPNGFLLIARVLKPWTTRLAASFSKKGLKPDARKFAPPAAK